MTRGFVWPFIVSSCVVVLATPRSTEALYLSNQATPWPGGQVPVCWDADADPEASDARAIRDAVESQWGRAAGLTFTGWGRCPARTPGSMPSGDPIVFLTRNFDGVREDVDSRCKDNAGCADVGMRTDRRPNIVYVPPDSKFVCRADPRNWPTPPSRITCIKGEAVHEFGHTLGFAHEQSRPDFSGCFPFDRYWPTREGGGTVLTHYDSSSVMNYCSWGGGTNLGQLTHRDVAGLQHVYGPKPDGTFAGQGGRCMDVHNVDLQAGNHVQIFGCWGGSNQSWDYHPVRGTVVTRADQSLCLDDASGGTQIGTPIDVWHCEHRANARWDLQRIYIKTLGQKCLFIDNNWNTIMTYCDTSQAMHYVYTPQGQFKRTLANLCLEFNGGVGTQGKQVACDASRSGQIIEPVFGHLVVNSLCLEVDDNFPYSANDNRRITLQYCEDKVNQKFKLSGFLKSSGGRCITSAPTDISRDGVRLVVGDCAQPYVFDFQPGEVFLVP